MLSPLLLLDGGNQRPQIQTPKSDECMDYSDQQTDQRIDHCINCNFKDQRGCCVNCTSHRTVPQSLHVAMTDASTLPTSITATTTRTCSCFCQTVAQSNRNCQNQGSGHSRLNSNHLPQTATVATIKTARTPLPSQVHQHSHMPGKQPKTNANSSQYSNHQTSSLRS